MLDSAVAAETSDTRDSSDSSEFPPPIDVGSEALTIPDGAIAGWELVAPSLHGPIAARGDDDLWLITQSGTDPAHRTDYVVKWDGSAIGPPTRIGYGAYDIGPSAICASPDAYWTVASGKYASMHEVTRSLVAVPGSVASGLAFACAPHAVWTFADDRQIHRHVDGVADGWPVMSAGLPALTAGFGSLYAPSDDDVWFAGSAGLIARWNGTSWRVTPSPVTYDLHNIAGSSPTDVYADGDGGVVHWDGTSFRVLPPPPGYSKIQLFAVASATEAYFVVPSGAVPTILLRWDGKSWSIVAPLAGPPGGFSLNTAITPSYLWYSRLGLYRRKR